MSIVLSGVSLFYDRQCVIKSADLRIERGEGLSILGPNGSGKTTLLHAIAGLISPKSGSILYDETDSNKLTSRARAQMIGFVPQILNATFDHSVLDYVVTGCAPHVGTFERPKAEHYRIAMNAICEMGIEHLVEKSYKQISGGERQQVAIARVIAQKPTFVLLDEPTAHLDFGKQIHVLRIIRRLTQDGFGVIHTTHNPDHVLLLGGRVAVIDRSGRLQSDNDQTWIDAEHLSSLYDTELQVKAPADDCRKVCFAPAL